MIFVFSVAAGFVFYVARYTGPVALSDEPKVVAALDVIDVGRFIPPGMPFDQADAAMKQLARLGRRRWLFPCYTIHLSHTVRFVGSGLKVEGCGGSSVVEMHDIPALELTSRTQLLNSDGSLRFVNGDDSLFEFGMEPNGATTADITITDLHLNRDGDTTGGAGLAVGQGARVFIERVSVSNFFHDFEIQGGVAIHLARVYSNTGQYFPFRRQGSADLLVTPYIAPADHSVHTGSGIYISDSEFSSVEKVSAGYELEGIDTTMVVNSYFGGQACQVRIDAARVEGGTNSQTIMFDNVYLDGGSTMTSGLCIPENRNGWDQASRTFDGRHYGPQQVRFANGTIQSHLLHDVDIEEPATDRIGLFNNNFGNTGKATSVVVKAHSVQLIGNNFFGAGRALDAKADLLIASGNILSAVDDCRLVPAYQSRLPREAAPNLDDGSCQHR